MRQLLRSRKARILALVTLLLACLLAWSGTAGRAVNPVQYAFGVLLTPVQKLAGLASEGVGAVWQRQWNAAAIAQENEQLREENARLQLQLSDYEQLQAENEAFRTQLGLQSQHPQWQLTAAFVTGRDPLALFGRFSLDKGSADGVAVGQPVLSELGYLVGQVQEVQPTGCTVVTLLDPSINVACRVGATRENGILTGDSAYYASGQTLLTGLPRNTAAAVGDRVVTSGLGGVFPAGLTVGLVAELTADVSGKTTTAVVQPGSAPDTLTRAYILRSAGEG